MIRSDRMPNDPTPEEIAQATARIQAAWTPAVRREREGRTLIDSWMLANVEESECEADLERSRKMQQRARRVGSAVIGFRCPDCGRLCRRPWCVPCSEPPEDELTGPMMLSQQALATLSARDRQMLEWHQCEGVTMVEIGRRLGLTKARVGQLLKRARTKLLAVLPTAA